MTDSYDFAIFGAGPLSALLAGLLAHDHGKRVIRVAAPVSPQRLPRDLDLALPLATRPETWRLLSQSVAETLTLMQSLGARDVVRTTRVRVVADLPATRDALGHMAHAARGYRQRSRDGVFSDVALIQGEITLHDSKVKSVPSARVTLPDSGRVALTIDGQPVDADRVVLVDNGALLDLLPEARRPKLLAPLPMTTTLTVPAHSLAAPIIRFPDRGVTLVQRSDLSVLALIAGESDIDARLASCLTGPFPLARRASSHYRRLIPRDGAPLIGPLGDSGMVVIGGLGDAAAFLAPPLARLLAGRATETEAAWFAAHDPARTDRSAVADFVAPGEMLP
jgi:hypothetical protein